MKFSKSEIIASNLGYSVNDNVVTNNDDDIIKASPSSNGYRKFTIREKGNTRKLDVFVHRLVAYNKFGNNIYEDGICVRHLDGDKLNNKNSNIAIGTTRDNTMDRDQNEVKQYALNASKQAALKKRKFTDKQVQDIKDYYNNGKTYKEVMLKFNISSKGTLHYILNNTYTSSI